MRGDLERYGRIAGPVALLAAAGVAIAGVGTSERKPGVITAGQFSSVQVGKADRDDVLLYFGQPYRPLVHANEIEMPEATKRESDCLVYQADQDARVRYRLCFDPATDELVRKQQAGGA